jgi:multidrug efflux pump
VPGVESSVAFPGLSINGFTNAPNAGVVFTTLKPFDQRTSKDQSGAAIAQEINKRLGVIQDAFIMVFPPPPVNGLGTIGGFKMMVEDRANVGYDELYKSVQALQGKAWADKNLAGVRTELNDLEQHISGTDRSSIDSHLASTRAHEQTAQEDLATLKAEAAKTAPNATVVAEKAKAIYTAMWAANDSHRRAMAKRNVKDPAEVVKPANPR